MTRTVIADGIIRLTGEFGILDKRSGKIFSEFVGDEKKEVYFTDAPAPIVAKKKVARAAKTK